MPTQDEYQQAIADREAADRVIQEYQTERRAALTKRLEEGGKFAADELVYAAWHRCRCGAGLAYPRGCGPFHYWECSAVLLGRPGGGHDARVPFTAETITSELQLSRTGGATTRPA